MEPRFDNYCAAILDTATIEAILRKQPADALAHFTPYHDELSNQPSTGVKPDGAETRLLHPPFRSKSRDRINERRLCDYKAFPEKMWVKKSSTRRTYRNRQLHPATPLKPPQLGNRQDSDRLREDSHGEPTIGVGPLGSPQILQ
jgi:hypothetical protein